MEDKNNLLLSNKRPNIDKNLEDQKTPKTKKNIKFKSKKNIKKETESNLIIKEENTEKENDLLIDISNLKYKNLKYEIDSWSSYISNFHPKNILIDSNIGGSLSKWSVKSKNEYLYIKLEKTSIVYMITFGKYDDPTNLKEFKIYAGLDKTNMVEILHSGLSDDNDYEPFAVKYIWNSTILPCK
jgi:hypothetical protein